MCFKDKDSIAIGGDNDLPPSKPKEYQRRSPSNPFHIQSSDPSKPSQLSPSAFDDYQAASNKIQENKKEKIREDKARGKWVPPYKRLEAGNPKRVGPWAPTLTALSG